MRLFIDCEFNGFCGELISMALIDDSGAEWYGVLPCEKPVDWVAKNVMPVLGKAPGSKGDFQKSLFAFLGRYQTVHVVADWPEDIAHFCNALIVGPGQRMNTPPLSMEVRQDLNVVSVVPHNALEDARAIRKLAMGMA